MRYAPLEELRGEMSMQWTWDRRHFVANRYLRENDLSAAVSTLYQTSQSGPDEAQRLAARGRHASFLNRQLRVLRAYGKLYELQPSWVVRLNAIVALSFAESAEIGLRALAELEEQEVLERYQPFHAARADLLRRAGRDDEATSAYRRALELTDNVAEQQFLERRLEEVSRNAEGDGGTG